MKFLSLPLLALLPLAACIQEPAAPAAPDETADACGASGLQHLVGQSRDVLAAMTFAEGTRIIGPGMPVTMDYRPDRLNIDYDDAGVITRVHCV